MNVLGFSCFLKHFFFKKAYDCDSCRDYGRQIYFELDCSRWYTIANTRFFTFKLDLGTIPYSMWQSWGAVRNTALRFHTVARLPQRQKLNFPHINFLCDSCAILWRHKTVARHARLLQDTQGVCTTNVRACTHILTHKYHKIVTGLLSDDLALYCTAAAGMLQNV